MNYTQFLRSRAVGLQTRKYLGLWASGKASRRWWVLKDEKGFKQEAKERKKEDRPWRQVGF